MLIKFGFLLVFGIPLLMANDPPEEIKKVDQISKEIAPEQTHHFTVNLTKGQFFMAVLYQDGIDVSITTYSPDGEKLREFDSPNGSEGFEPVTIVSDSDGAYRLEVKPLDWNDNPGNYSLSVTRIEPRATSPSGQVDQLFAMYDRQDSPGVAVGVVEDGELILKQGFGNANLEYDIPISPSTVFHMASVSKQFTAFSIALLADQGKLSVSDDVRKYIPEVPDFGKTITLEHLIYHTSGLRDQWNLLAMAGWRLDDVITKEQILKLIARQKDLNFDPGDEFLYCNTGYTLLAEVVARVSEMSFAEWTAKHIFEPLGMARTLFYDDHEKIVKNRAYSYQQATGGYQKSVLSYANVGATSLFTTIEDMQQWVNNFTELKVGTSSVMEMMNRRGILNNGDTLGYAYGQSIGNYKGLKTISHGGADAGYRTYLVRFPEQQGSFIVLSNMASANTYRMAMDMADVYLSDLLVPDKEEPIEAGEADKMAVRIDEEILKEYCGRYEILPGLILDVELKEGKLIGKVAGQPSTTLEPRSETEFLVAQADATIIFQRNELGQVNQLLLKQSGEQVTAARLAPFDPGSVDHNIYTGTYYSEEIGTAYTFTVKDEKFIATHQRHSDIELEPAKEDQYSGDAWFFSQVVFTRDESGNVKGCKVTNGRVRNLIFTKLNLR